MDQCSPEECDRPEGLRYNPAFSNSMESACLHRFTLTDRADTSRVLPQYFNLSYLRSLRSLEVTASSVSRLHASNLFCDYDYLPPILRSHTSSYYAPFGVPSDAFEEETPIDVLFGGFQTFWRL